MSTWASMVMDDASATVFTVMCAGENDEDMCELGMKDGTKKTVPVKSLDQYIKLIEGEYLVKTDLFITGEMNFILGLNSERFNGKSEPSIIPAPAMPATSPFSANSKLVTKTNSYGVSDSVYHVELVVIGDDVVVNDIVLNKKPKCIGDQLGKYPKRLSMGNTLIIKTGCRPIQLDVTTDVGGWTLRFE